MFSRLLLRRSPFHSKPPLSRRLASHTASHSRSGTRRLIAASGITLTAAGLILASKPATVYADALKENTAASQSPASTPLSVLVRSYFVYTMCSFPTLVDWSPAILDTLTSIPGLRQLTEAFVERTFFRHFVGGPTTNQCIPLLERLRAENKGVLFAYSVEVDEDVASGHASGSKSEEQVHKRIVKEMIHSIDVAADFEDSHASRSTSPSGRRTWIAIKLTALVPDHEALINFSKYLVASAQKHPHDPPVAFPGCPRDGDLRVIRSSKPDDHLRSSDISDLAELYNDLRSICAHAQKRNVRIIVDAEHSWYQPAIDSFTLELMREFNKVQSSASTYPLIYATFQAYLRRTPEYLAQSLKDAKAGGYILGVKLVRGAYHEQEAAVHFPPSLPKPANSPSISLDRDPPVWTSKADTDTCYNTCARLVLQTIVSDIALANSKPSLFSTPTAGVLFGSHNWDSVRLVLQSLADAGLARPVGVLPAGIADPMGRELGGDSILEIPDNVTDRVTLGQLFGMSDALTNYIVARTRSSSPFVIKYVPYGALSEVMPYLARRAVENKTVLGNGNAALERHQAWVEIRRKFSFSG